MAAGEGEAESVRYRVKPMNCPMHILIYASQQRSYRDLPVRLAEIANVYRNERSGTLHGMLRVRGLTMDDAHIFLREDQIEPAHARSEEHTSELQSPCNLVCRLLLEKKKK